MRLQLPFQKGRFSVIRILLGLLVLLVACSGHKSTLHVYCLPVNDLHGILLALREMNTSVWDLTLESKVAKGFDGLRRQMLPDR